MILQGNALSIPLADESVNCVVSSPPYFGLRSYLDANDPLKGHELGAESTPAEYVAHLVQVFREVKRVLKSDGTVWLVLGDTYCSRPNGPNMASSTLGGSLAPHAQFRMAHGLRKTKLWPGLKPKDLIGIPWRVAFALQEDGWWLRSDIIWAKPNPMPESVTDRPTRSHEYVFLLTKSARYWYDDDAIAEESEYPVGSRKDEPQGSFNGKYGSGAFRAIRNTRNARSVWTIATQPTPMAHFATFPQELAKRCILAGCPDKVCKRCGAPRERVTEHHRRTVTGNLNPKHTQSKVSGLSSAGWRKCETPNAYDVTLGYAPTCICDADTTAGVVLDPFSGSGTVAFVATGCGRQGIGLDMKMEYCQMGKERSGML